MRFGSFLALIQCVFLPPGRSAAGQAPALPVTLIGISNSEKNMDACMVIKGWSSMEAHLNRFLNGNRVEDSGRCDEYMHHIVLRWGQWSASVTWRAPCVGQCRLRCGGWGAMDNTNYEDVRHLPHTWHTHLKQQLDCDYTYSGSARGANLCLQASCLNLMGKQILYGRRNYR